MTQAEHVNYWLDTAAHDWDTVAVMRMHHPRAALVFTHWTLEKLSKALWVQQHSEPIPPASDDVAEVLAATSFSLTSAQTAFVGHLKAAHDDVIESDPEHPYKPAETPQTLLTQTDELRRQLLKSLGALVSG